MARATLKDRVAALLTEGRTVSEIARLIDRTKAEVHQIRSRLRRERNQAQGVTAACLAEMGLGYQDISTELGISERDAKDAVFHRPLAKRKAS